MNKYLNTVIYSMSTPIYILHDRLAKIESIHNKLKSYRKDLNELKQNHKDDADFNERYNKIKNDMKEQYELLKEQMKSAKTAYGGIATQSLLESLALQRELIKNQNEKNLALLASY